MNRLIYRSLVLLTFVFLIPGCSDDWQFPTDVDLTGWTDEDLTALIQSRVEDAGAGGIVLGVLEADGTTRIVSYGDAGANARTLGARSVFEIGSITKVFTGIMLADMVARGEVSLSDPVSDHLPSSITMPSLGGREITLLDLATHRSGLPRLPDNLSPLDWRNPYADYTVQDLYRFLSSHELRRVPGSEYEYSNLAVGLLGVVLASVGGGSYEDIVSERILEPLDMNMTGLTLQGDLLEWMAEGHNQYGNVVPLWDFQALAGAGALRSNVEDMLTFLAANTGPAETQLERSMRESHEVRESIGAGLDIGLNWLVRHVGDDRIITHSGGTPGFRTFIGFDPDKNIGVALLTNSAHGADDIGLHLINPELPLAIPPEERVEIEVAVEILETYVGVYEFTPTFSIVVTLEGGSLFGQATGQSKFQMYAESETKFFLKVVDAQITFTKDDSGAVTGMILHQNGMNQPATKVG